MRVKELAYLNESGETCAGLVVEDGSVHLWDQARRGAGSAGDITFAEDGTLATRDIEVSALAWASMSARYSEKCSLMVLPVDQTQVAGLACPPGNSPLTVEMRCEELASC